MGSENLVLTVRFHGDASGTARYHGMAQGRPEWPPSPARLYQAIVTGVARGGAVPPFIASALEWLEALPAPMIAAPRATLGRTLQLYVPNNDADTLEDPRDVSGLRTRKIEKPSLFDGNEPLLYSWRIPTDDGRASDVAKAAEQVYQLGRGSDMAWAVADIVDDETLESRLRGYRGVVLTPGDRGGGGTSIACPTAGSLASLDARHRAIKLRVRGAGRAARTFFANPPKPRFAEVSYDNATTESVFELIDRERDTPWPWPLTRVVKLVETLRDSAAERLRRALPEAGADVDKALIGRRPEGALAVPSALRIRLVPLPSIGFDHADRAIRRILLQMPSQSPLGVEDLEWSFSGLDAADPETGEVSPWILARGVDTRMRAHYVGPSRVWRSVTPAALPDPAQRRRIDRARQTEEPKDGLERRAEESRAVAAVHTALRQAGVRRTAVRVHVQREPFERKGARAELFAGQTRFAKESLWHVELELDAAISGPLVIGDGRFLGLGLLAPHAHGERGVHVFAVANGLALRASPHEVTRAFRRAVMSRAQRYFPSKASLPTYFSGHGSDGSPARADESAHIAYAFEPESSRLYLFAPHVVDHRGIEPREHHHLETLRSTVEGLTELRAGRAGRLDLQSLVVCTSGDAILRESRRWTSATPYVVTRHARKLSAMEALATDVRAECHRVGLPDPSAVSVRNPRGVSGLGLVGQIEVEFAVPVRGPLLLGRNRHFGGGLFRAP